MTPRVAILAVTLALPLPALAADADGKFGVDGVGRAACADLTAAVASEDASAVSAFASWTSGFLTATNALSNQTFDVTPWQTETLILNQMRGYCDQNPDTLYVNAVGSLLRALSPARLVSSSPQQTLTQGDTSLTIYDTVLEGVRSALTDAGLPVEDGPDGLRAALTAYQTDRQLDPTGLPDQQTLVELFLR